MFLLLGGRVSRYAPLGWKPNYDVSVGIDVHPEAWERQGGLPRNVRVVGTELYAIRNTDRKSIFAQFRILVPISYPASHA